MPKTRTILTASHNEEILRRIAATQRLQGCDCVCSRGVATDAGRQSDFPFFEIPNWGVRLVVLLLVIGFPVAVILAWAFELTPEGLKRTEDVDLSKSVTHKTGRKLDFFIIAVLLVVIAPLLFQRLRPNVSSAVSSALGKSI